MIEIVDLRMNQIPPNEEHQIIETLSAYIQDKGGDYNTWSIGICKDMPDIVPLLHSTHSKYWVYYKISSFHIAEGVLNRCVSKLGMNAQNSSIRRDEGPCTVYAYKKMDTNPVEV
jgi:hypothetical protein